jgi:glycogen phosphorylase
LKHKSVFASQSTIAKAMSERMEKYYLTPIEASSVRQRYNVLGSLIREEIAFDWMQSNQEIHRFEGREVYYFSMEFLIGRLITNNLINMGIRGVVEAAFQELGYDLNEVEEYESDPGLGTGGLGRLAACYLDSLASQQYAGFGQTIRYRYGLFRQKIKNGYQEERPDNWLSDGYVWEIRKEEEAEDIPYFGYVEYDGKMSYKPAEFIKAVPYDVPIVGADNHFVTYLRMWNAEPSRKYPKNKSAFDYEFELQKISGFLYPDDTTDEGKRLRLMQQYFFSSAGVKSVCRKHKAKYGTLANLHEHVVLHINDTHPTLIIPELMRILLDEEHMEWVDAWNITQNATAYTNHTIMSEALEKWPIHLLQPILPRIYQLIEEINRRFMNELIETYSHNNVELIQKLAIIQNGMIRMANLCIVAAKSVNGVAKLHTEILKNIEMKEFYQLYPAKFQNVTNGITHRRWLIHSNPELSALLDETIGSSWRHAPADLAKLLTFQDDPSVQAKFFAVKRQKKVALAAKIYAEQGVELDPDSIFDIQVKRLHEYKRQLLNALHILDLYHLLKTDPAFKATYVPHSFIFGAKAASGYHFAKKIIKLINTIAQKVNNDPETSGYLKVVFVENYNVTYAETIMPSADISEQISTASKEASGTGNMKLMMNGAVTIGTEDGANVEIHELVGDDAIFIFGMETPEVTALYQSRAYRPKQLYDEDPTLHRVLDQLVNGFFADVDKNEFREIFERLIYEDAYFVLKDFAAYKQAHLEANAAYRDQVRWRKMALINIATSGVFSSDRSIQDYANRIWNLTPVR